MKLFNLILIKILLLMILSSCQEKKETLKVDVFETSRAGNQLTQLNDFTKNAEEPIQIHLRPEKTYQTFLGFGGSFTESSAYLLNQLSPENRKKIIDAYFADEGARYSLTRTHMNSCDFSLGQYSYAPVEDDLELAHFSVKEDEDDIIPMIKDAMQSSSEGFKILSSPWTAPPWMKDNNDWVGGKLKKEYYPTWALFFSKYADAYADHGIDIWGFTVENEPHGNGNNWESMHYTPQEMTDFVNNHLGPQLQQDGKENLKILGYDQNREGLKEWVDEMFDDRHQPNYFDGTAVHWYESTFKVFPEALQYARKKAPNKHLLQTEACVDDQVPVWQEDDWYWRKEATDWGFTWAPEERKHLHPKYRPVYRYARDIIGCMNNEVEGWIDWNMVLDKQGGPNWFENWCVAPVIVDPDKDEVYFTPLYYVMAHFSKFIRPGAKRIDFELEKENDLLVSAVTNPDGSHAIVVFNTSKEEKFFELQLNNQSKVICIAPQAIQTLVLNDKN
ncbi:MAG: glycosyl hydrolase family 30 [Flavobacteriaceae bacterium]|nr:glycosyl hydrolase family 30 [Flavobacteriaceae bacterium]